jgi:hypothetical protein
MCRQLERDADAESVEPGEPQRHAPACVRVRALTGGVEELSLRVADRDCTDRQEVVHITLGAVRDTKLVAPSTIVFGEVASLDLRSPQYP